MFIIRKIGKTLRGQARPFQIITAGVLGALIGFAPPIGQAPLYIIGVILLLAIVNANFFLATATAALCKLLALALTPVSFELGLLLVDGPLQPLFKLLVNAPVSAWMGFEYYTTAGGTALGLVIGLGLGLGYIKAIAAFRKKMAKLETGSEKYADFVSKRTVRVFMWVLFGGKAKLTYAELAELKKIGNPVRPLGVVFALLVVGLLVIVQQLASGPIVTTLLRGQLEQFHGATVDVDGVDIDLAGGGLTVDRLAMADPDNLEYDLIRANQLNAKLSTNDLLRKRFTIDSIVVDDAVQGAKRDKPGVLIGKRPKPTPPPKDEKTLEEWFDQAKVWKDRLDTFREWMEKLKGPPKDEQAKKPSAKDRLREWAEQYGYDKVKAAHLIVGSPSVLVRDAKINKLRATWPEEETLDIHATNWSTNPALVEQSPRITVKSSGDSFDLDTTIAPRARVNEMSTLKMTLRNQSIDKTMSDLDLGSDATLTGGTWQAGIDGDWSDLSGLDLPLTLVMQDTTLSLPSIQPTPIERMPIEFSVIGALDQPSLRLDREQFMQSLMDNAGKAVLNQYVGQASGELKKKLNEALGEEGGGKLQDALGGLLGGKKKNGEDETDEDSASEEEKSTGDKLREGLGGFLKRGDDDEE